MGNYLSLEQVFDRQDDNEIYKSKPSVVVTTLLFTAGVIFVALNGIIPAFGETLSTLFVLTGAGLLIWGVVYAFFKKTSYKLIRNNERVTFREIYFDVKERDRLIHILSDGNVNELEKLKPATIDALKLRVAATPDGNFCYTQVISYVPYEFTNANEARKHSPEEARIILDMLNKRKQ
jgi:hypothetical protein